MALTLAEDHRLALRPSPSVHLGLAVIHLLGLLPAFRPASLALVGSGLLQILKRLPERGDLGGESLVATADGGASLLLGGDLRMEKPQQLVTKSKILGEESEKLSRGLPSSAMA